MRLRESDSHSRFLQQNQYDTNTNMMANASMLQWQHKTTERVSRERIDYVTLAKNQHFSHAVGI